MFQHSRKHRKKGISKEIALAEEFKKKIDEEASKDPIRFQITEHLNILTVDNYKQTSENIYEIIKDDIENQEKFLDVLFNKSVNEKAYVKLYAKLCKDFDKKLPQKSPKKDDKNPKKKPTSKKRDKLLDIQDSNGDKMSILYNYNSSKDNTLIFL